MFMCVVRVIVMGRGVSKKMLCPRIQKGGWFSEGGMMRETVCVIEIKDWTAI